MITSAKYLSILLVWLAAIATPTWFTDFDRAQKEAAASGRHILVSFQGSDWCGHCMRFKKEVLDKQAFEDFATQNLVLVKADFPRQKKNQLSAEQVKLNEKLAEKYNPQGEFPLHLLLDARGKVLKTWHGFPKKASCETFVTDMQHAIADSK